MATYTISDGATVLHNVRAVDCLIDNLGGGNELFILWDTEEKYVPAAIVRADSGFTITPPPTDSTRQGKSLSATPEWLAFDSAHQIARIESVTVDASTNFGTAGFYRANSTEVAQVNQVRSIIIIRADCVL